MRRSVTALILVAAMASNTVADAGRRRLPTRLATCGQIVTSSFKLANDLFCATDGLVIGADGITVDLNGHTLRGSGTGTAGIRLVSHNSVTIRNGFVEGFDRGVSIAGIKNIVSGMSVVQPAFFGVAVSGPRNVIRGNTINGAEVGTVGINANIDDGLIESNSVVGFAEFGIRLHSTAQRPTIRRNAVRANRVGISIEDAISTVVSRNVVELNIDHGIVVQQGSDPTSVSRNAVLNNGQTGIIMFAGNSSVARNSVRGNDEFGIQVSGPRSSVAMNAVVGNRVAGIVVAEGFANPDDTSVVGNTANANGESGIIALDGERLTFRGNRTDNNEESGIFVFESVTPVSVSKNTANGNGELGIGVQAAVASLRMNRAGGNGLRNGIDDDTGLGVFADGTVSGSRNVARGNDDPRECDPATIC